MSYRTTRRILAEYESWAVARSLVPPEAEHARRWRSRLEILIHGRADYLEKRDPTYWRSGDVHELLIRHCATRQVDAWDLTTHAPDTVRDFLRFLDQTGRLHPGSTRAGALLKELDRLTPKFAAAMADVSRWRLAKRVFTAMLSDGVDLEDEDEVDRWAEKFSTLDAAARHPVLGDLMDAEPGLGAGPIVVHDGQVAFLFPHQVPCKHRMWPDARCVCGECPGPGENPPVELPSEGELARAVAGRGSGLLRRLLEFADWIGAQGQPVDKHGELTRGAVREVASVFRMEETKAVRLRDLPSLSRLWRLSLEFGILELRRTQVLPGPGRDLVDRALRGAAEPGEALTLWCGLYDDASVPFQARGGGPSSAALAECMEPWPSFFLRHLAAQSRRGEQASFEEIMEAVLREHADRVPLAADEAFSEMIRAVVLLTLGYLAEHGAVEVSGGTAPAPPDEAAAGLRAMGIEPWVFHSKASLQVQLTDLGRYAMHR
jgi:hypothetical protein